MTVISVVSAKLHLYTVSFDDGTVGMIDKTVWEHSGLAKDSELTDEVWQELCTFSEKHRAREKALYYLSLRDYGKRELMLKLIRSGIVKELATETVDSLAQSGLINDERYAAMLARDMSHRKLYPKRRIAMALGEKGFDRDVIDAALEQLPDEETEQALELLNKKRYNKTNDPMLKEKQLAMLARYGFSYSTARRAVMMYNEHELEGE